MRFRSIELRFNSSGGIEIDNLAEFGEENSNLTQTHETKDWVAGALLRLDDENKLPLLLVTTSVVEIENQQREIELFTGQLNETNTDSSLLSLAINYGTEEIERIKAQIGDDQ